MTDLRSYGGVYIGRGDFSVQPETDGTFSVLCTRWFRYRDEKDFEDFVVDRGLSRDDAEAKVAEYTRRVQMKPCDHPRRQDAYILMFGVEDRPANEARNAARLVKKWEWQCQMGYYYRTASMLLRRLGEREG